MADIVNNSRERGVINVNINEVIYDNLDPATVPPAQEEIPEVTDITLGEWTYINNRWVEGETVVNAGEMYLPDGQPYWDTKKIILNSTDKNSTDVSTIFETHHNADTACDIDIYVWDKTSFKWKKTIYKVYFRLIDGETDIYRTVFLSPPNSAGGGAGYLILSQGSLIKIVYSYTQPEIVDDQNVHTVTGNFSEYTAIGQEAYGDLVSNINIIGKDNSYVRVYYSLTPSNIPDTDYFAMGIVLGHAGSDAHEIYYGQIAQKDNGDIGDTPLRGNFVLPVKLGDYDWYQFIVGGNTPAPDAAFTVNFVFEDLK